MEKTFTPEVKAYTAFVEERIHLGWEAFLLSVTFNQLPAVGPWAQIALMTQEMEHLYYFALPRLFRRPHSESPAELPLMIAAPDLPVFKHGKRS
jgi:hypothetical protein